MTDNIEIVTSLVVGEYADNTTNFNNETEVSGLFLKPSVIEGRTSDITDYVISSQDEYGKLSFVEQNFQLVPEPKVDVIQTVESTVTANGRSGTIHTLDLLVNVSDYVDIIINSQYVNVESTVLTTLEIDSFTTHLVSNVFNISNGLFIVRLSNFYNVVFNDQVIIHFVIL